jgi:hypothetical protein
LKAYSRRETDHAAEPTSLLSDTAEPAAAQRLERDLEKTAAAFEKSVSDQNNSAG